MFHQSIQADATGPERVVGNRRLPLGGGGTPTTIGRSQSPEWGYHKMANLNLKFTNFVVLLKRPIAL